jgi:hypothetical protein
MIKPLSQGEAGGLDFLLACGQQCKDCKVRCEQQWLFKNAKMQGQQKYKTHKPTFCVAATRYNIDSFKIQGRLSKHASRISLNPVSCVSPPVIKIRMSPAGSRRWMVRACGRENRRGGKPAGMEQGGRAKDSGSCDSRNKMVLLQG